jgi:hypothetical protein
MIKNWVRDFCSAVIGNNTSKSVGLPRGDFGGSLPDKSINNIFDGVYYW